MQKKLVNVTLTPMANLQAMCKDIDSTVSALEGLLLDAKHEVLGFLDEQVRFDSAMQMVLDVIDKEREYNEARLGKIERTMDCVNVWIAVLRTVLQDLDVNPEEAFAQEQKKIQEELCAKRQPQSSSSPSVPASSPARGSPPQPGGMRFELPPPTVFTENDKNGDTQPHKEDS